jgi:hypothetical protein
MFIGRVGKGASRAVLTSSPCARLVGTAQARLCPPYERASTRAHQRVDE